MATDSDTIRLIKQEAADTSIRMIEARIKPVVGLQRMVVSTLVIAICGAVGFGITTSSTNSAQTEQIIAGRLAHDALEQCVILMGENTTEIARSVGRIEGMLKVNCAGP